MRVFVTGATGFIGSAVVEELLGAGHQVTGLARSEASAKKLAAAGAQVLRGDIDDLDCLRRGAAGADGAIHTAFYHALGQMPLGKRMGVLLGGLPGGIVNRYVAAAVAADRRAIDTIGHALASADRPLVAAFATMAMPAGRLATEDAPYSPRAVGGPRGATEELMHAMASQGIRTSIVRLPPTVHGVGDHGFMERLIQTARKKKASAYVGDGLNRWPAVHRVDAARVFRLALESGPAGGTYHAVAEEGVAFREIAGVIGRKLKVPVVSKPAAEAAKQFSFLSGFVAADNPVSSRLTQERLGWRPTGPGLLDDLEHAGYFEA